MRGRDEEMQKNRNLQGAECRTAEMNLEDANVTGKVVGRIWERR